MIESAGPPSRHARLFELLRQANLAAKARARHARRPEPPPAIRPADLARSLTAA